MIELDIIAQRYGQLPSTIRHLSAEDFVFDLLVAGIGCENDAKEAAKQKRRSKA